MTHEWILDVLTDLKAYARENEFRALAEQLDDARHIASAEIVARAERSVLNGNEGSSPTTASHEGEARGAL